MIGTSLSLLRHIRDDLQQSEIIVGVSGKDSLVTLDLCSRVFDQVHGFFLYLIPNLESVERTIRAAEARYGITVHRLRHPDMSDYMRFSRLRKVDPAVEDSIRRNLRWADIYAIMRQRTGAEWIAQGHRITDSLQRRAMIQSKRGFELSQRRVYPIWDWKPREVIAYLRSKRIPIPVMFGSRIDKTSGIAPGSADCMKFLREKFPEDYRRIVEVFPGVEVMKFRDELRERYGRSEAMGEPDAEPALAGAEA